MAASEPMSASDADPSRDALLRELQLVDRILGLEGELAREQVLKQGGGLMRDEIERLEREIQGSITWRAGRAVLAPGRALRRVFRRGR